MIRSLDQDTRSNYGAGLLRFTQFCDSINVPENQRMPASEALISQFVAAFVGITATKTLNNWMAGLQFWHIVNGAPWLASALVHHTRRGFSKMVPPSSRRAKRPPVTIEALSILFDHLSFVDPFDCAVGAAALTAFWCCCRYARSTSLTLTLSHLEHLAVWASSSYRAPIFLILSSTFRELFSLLPFSSCPTHPARPLFTYHGPRQLKRKVPPYPLLRVRIAHVHLRR